MGYCFIGQLTLVYIHLPIDLLIMSFDRMFEVVNVDKLNVKLVVKVFNLLKLIFGECLADGFLEFDFIF